MTEMLAAVYHGPRDVRVESKAIPAIADDELLLRIDSASICATDIRILNGNHRKVEPGSLRIPGHEIAGTVVDSGAGVRQWRPGQRVFVAPNMGCGKCRQCRSGRNNLCQNSDAFGITLDGGFAQYMRVTAPAIAQGNLISIPDSIESEAMALAEPFACVLRGQRALNVTEGDVTVIQGAGPIGLMHLLLARQRGASRIIVSDPISTRLEMARKLGADVTVDPQNQDLDTVVRDETAGEGADVVIVAVGVHDAQQQAVRIAATGGRINLFAGLPKDKPEIRLDANTVHYKELIVTGTTACSTGDCVAAADLISGGRIDLRPLIGARYTLPEALTAFESARTASGLKVVLLPGLN